MQQNKFRHKVTQFIPWPYQDPSTNEERNGIYIRATVDTGNQLIDELFKAAKFKQGKSVDINIFLFCEKVVNEKGEVLSDSFASFTQLREAGKFTHIDALTARVPWSDLPYHRRWTRDANNGAKKGDLVCDTNGTPILYDHIEVVVLCSPEGEPWEDIQATARRWYTRELKRGNIVPADGTAVPVSAPAASADDAAARFEEDLEAFAQTMGQDKELLRAGFKVQWDKQNATPAEQARVN